MNDTDFFSSNYYIYLPTKKYPKVALTIDNPQLSINAFKLYNPFSKKAKFLKQLTSILFKNLHVSSFLFGDKKEKSRFINYLEEELNCTLIISIYFATAKDKVVLQLQSNDAKIIGYLKYPLNDIGLKHIKNEIKAFDILSKKKIIEPCMLCKKYESRDFLLLKELDGDIGIVDRDSINIILKRFERDESYKLSNHPRMEELKKSLLENKMLDYLAKVDKICKNSIVKYKLVYEHGDFTPWNIVKVKNDYIPFDFEYFIEDGLEYFDLIKYYYQIGRLLYAKDNKDLIKYIQKEINILSILELLQIYLIKEVIQGKEENKSMTFELTILQILETK